MGMFTAFASLASTIAGWHCTAALNSLLSAPEDSEAILPPQQKPRIDQDWKLPPGASLLPSATTLGILERVLGGAALVEKK